MKTTKLFFTAIAAISFSMLASCGDEGDTADPTIVLNEPEEEEVLALGGTLHLDMDLSDNEALDEYKVDIHFAAGHTHSRAEQSASIFTDTWDDASGLRNKHVHHDITLPEDAAPGDYHLIIYCTDMAGNEAHVVRTIELEGGEEHEHEHEH